jgi:putative acetyltransferase
VKIRPATEADVDAIAEAHVDSILTLGPAAYDPAIVNAWATPRSGASYLKAMQRGETFFVAVERDVVLGFSSHRVDGDRHRTAIYVRGIAARRKIGSRLLGRAIDAARSLGASDVWVDASLLAVPFYRQNGFTDLGPGTHRMPSGLEMQCVYMKKTLGIAESVERMQRRKHGDDE